MGTDGAKVSNSQPFNEVAEQDRSGLFEKTLDTPAVLYSMSGAILQKSIYCKVQF